ncbi:unnamed protein product [Paramecium sonneborni]|uniref:Transmembrane protein n=1 Tax=Paramecium sonneborni TaxID=65129 RepID=A0A8S1RIA7_9CILI|nr:unnamed protein product [Paramecium sonneborni]
MLFIGSFLIYSFEFSQLMFGWIHISMISLMLIINLIIDLLESINNAKTIYQKEQQKKQLQELNKYYNNQLQRLVFHRCNTLFMDFNINSFLIIIYNYQLEFDLI